MVPLKGRTRIDFVCLDMVMAEHPCVVIQFLIRQLVTNQLPGRIPWIIAFNLRKYFAQSGGEMGEGVVLLGREIILHQLPALDVPTHRLRPGWAAHKTGSANPAVAKT